MRCAGRTRQARSGGAPAARARRGARACGDARLGRGGVIRRARGAELRRRHAVRRLALGRAGGAGAGGAGGLAVRAGVAARARSRLGGVSAPRPAILARGPWAADQIEARWLERPSTRRPRWTAPPTPPFAACASAARPLTTGWPRGSPGGARSTTGCVLDLQPSRWALRLVEGNACDSLTALCVVRSARRSLAGGAARRAGSRPGPTAGRSAPAARSTSARARRARSLASCEEEWQLDRRPAERRGARGPAQRHGDAGRASPPCPTPPTPCPTTSTTTGPGGRPTWSAGPTRPTSACRRWRPAAR